jgi:hypothetical protein
MLYRQLLFALFPRDRWHAMTQRRFVRVLLLPVSVHWQKKSVSLHVCSLCLTAGCCVMVHSYTGTPLHPRRSERNRSRYFHCHPSSKQEEQQWQQSCNLHSSNKPCSDRKLSTDNTYLLHMNNSSGSTRSVHHQLRRFQFQQQHMYTNNQFMNQRGDKSLFTLASRSASRSGAVGDGYQ